MRDDMCMCANCQAGRSNEVVDPKSIMKIKITTYLLSKGLDPSRALLFLTNFLASGDMNPCAHGAPGPMRRSFVEVAKFLLNSVAVKDFGATEKKLCIRLCICSVKELVQGRAPAKGPSEEGKVMFTTVYENIDRYELTRLSDKDFVEKFPPKTWHSGNNGDRNVYLREYAALFGVDVAVRRRPIYFDEDHTIEQMVSAAQARIALAKAAKGGSKKSAGKKRASSATKSQGKIKKRKTK